MASFDRPRHGWEGISNGGELYGNKGNNGYVNNEKDYLQALSAALKMSMSDDSKVSGQAVEHLKEAQRQYGVIPDRDAISQLENDLNERNRIVDDVQTDIDDISARINALFDESVGSNFKTR